MPLRHVRIVAVPALSRTDDEDRLLVAGRVSDLDDLERVARAAVDLVAGPPVEPVQAFVRESRPVLGHELVHRHRVLLSRGRAAPRGDRSGKGDR
jgi:hypothetical protein